MGSNPIHCVTVVVVSCSMADTTFKGEEATLRAILRVIELGGQPSRPVMEGGRYDLVLDLAGTLWRCKSSTRDRRRAVRLKSSHRQQPAEVNGVRSTRT